MILGIKQNSDGAGGGILLNSPGGTMKTTLVNTSAIGTVATTGIQLNATSPIAQDGSSYPCVLCRVWSTTSTAPTATLHLYDSATASGCTLANQVWEGTLAGQTGQAPLDLQIDIAHGLFYALGSTIVANGGIAISWS